MRRRTFLAGLAGAAGLAHEVTATGFARGPQQPQDWRQASSFMYVGSFTGKDGGRGEGLSVYQRNVKTQTWTLVQLLKDIADPSFLILDRARRHLYSAHGDGTQVTAYNVDETTGRLTVLNRQPSGGTNGVHLAIDGTDRFLALANYASGSLALFPINRDGSLAALADLASMKGEPGPHRTQQESPHPHDCPFDRTGRYIVVPDKGLDRVFLYRLDAARGKLLAGDLRVRAGQGRPEATADPADDAVRLHRRQHRCRGGGRAVRQVRVWIESRTQQHRCFFGRSEKGNFDSSGARLNKRKSPA